MVSSLYFTFAHHLTSVPFNLIILVDAFLMNKKKDNLAKHNILHMNTVFYTNTNTNKNL